MWNVKFKFKFLSIALQLDNQDKSIHTKGEIFHAHIFSLC